uniref:Actin-binding, cofilin/tropomyosin type n=1 Tax=Tanacetum cinerariifolium TaxID=118510 RepID=A0A699H7I0_TANCI|nr:actin-binding, cofilin/tropomyosin type [Tanacetum cinerariifolium]GEX48529.1 actin-binding, cofilin/tropomyosin type [Tanacetum cinerariifolium]
MQTIEGMFDTCKSLDASLVDTKSSGTESKEHDTSSKSGNDAHGDDADIRQIYDEEPMNEVQMTTKINVFATRQQHTKQSEFNNEGEVDQNAKQCHDKCLLPAKLTDNQITELSNQSLKSKNFCLKNTVAQFQKDFSRMEAHCVNHELKYQNQVLKERQHGQFSKVKSNETNVKHDIDVIETINIKLEHKVANLLKENETLKKHYKELSDSIKTTRVKNIEHTTSLIAKNTEFKSQLQEKEFAIAALKNKLRN